MAFTERQFVFARYLLNKIGFTDNNLISTYLEKLESIYGRYHKEWRQKIYDTGYKRDYWVLRYSNSECIDQLLKEIEIKKNVNNIKSSVLDFNSSVSATDLSSFDFCPASYSISKSFRIEHPTSEDKRLIGINLHETLRLLNKRLPVDFKESDVLNNEVLYNEQIIKIKNCELVFSGHGTEDKKYFINEQKKYIGQPDYIFKDPSGKYFVVEEKFKFLNNEVDEEHFEYENILKKREKIKNTFFSNHIIQLQSYINFIQDFNIEYGVLIYWFYDFYNDMPNIHSVSLKVVRKNEYQNLLETTLTNLFFFISNRSIDFSKNINPQKCAACSVNKYCAHKTRNIKELIIPYKKSDLLLKYVEFPEELKKAKEK